MEKLTKEEAIKRHRILWTKIAEKCDEEDFLIGVTDFKLKQNVFLDLGWDYIMNFCWCCEYAKVENGYDCDYCPILWPKGMCIDPQSCDCGDGAQNGYLYDSFDQAVRYCNKVSAREIALEIANLPEKEISFIF